LEQNNGLGNVDMKNGTADSNIISNGGGIGITTGVRFIHL
jgi:hypothetical protein